MINLNRKFRSILYILNCYILRKKILWCREKLFNIKMYMLPFDVVGRHIYKYGIYEEEETVFLLDHLKLNKKNILIDVGANIGWYTSHFANKFQCKILAFEPDPENYNILKLNTKPYKNLISTFKLGLSDSENTKTLYQYKKSNRGRHSMVKNQPYIKKINVKTAPLDLILERKKINFQEIKFLKIDIEGYEYQALLGAKKVLAHCPVIFSEFSPKKMQSAGLNPQKYVAILEDNHYESFEIKNKSLEPINLKKIKISDRVYNILWKKNNASSLRHIHT